MPGLRDTVDDLLDYTSTAGPLERSVTVGFVALIVANVAAVILESQPALAIR